MKQAATLSQLSHGLIQRVRAGTTKTLTPLVEARVLAIPARVAYGCVIPAWPTRRLIRDLLSDGFTRQELARRSGASIALRIPIWHHPGADCWCQPRIRHKVDGTIDVVQHQARDRVRVKTALQISALYRFVTAEGPEITAE